MAHAITLHIRCLQTFAWIQATQCPCSGNDPRYMTAILKNWSDKVSSTAF